MDELEKLFAEATASVRRVTGKQSSQEAPSPGGGEKRQPEVSDESAPEIHRAPPPAGQAVQLTGGTRRESGFRAIGPAGPVEITWAGVRSLTLGRLEGGQVLAFQHEGRLYYFADDEMNYKGLVSRLEPTATANWRAWIGEMAERAGSTEDAGVQAVTGMAGMIPRYPSLEALLAKVRG